MVREFANGPGAWGSIPVRIIPKTREKKKKKKKKKTQHTYLILPCLTLSIRYRSRVNGAIQGKK